MLLREQNLTLNVIMYCCLKSPFLKLIYKQFDSDLKWIEHMPFCYNKQDCRHCFCRLCITILEWHHEAI